MLLTAKLGIVFGVANKRSIAWAIAQAWHKAGAQLAFTYQGERLKDNVEELAGAFGAEAPLMTDGGSILAMTYYGSEKVVPHYNVMGVAKASLEASTRYLAHDLGPQKIRVNCISAGPVNTLAARGIAGFTDMLKHYQAHAPLKRNVLPDELGATGVFLASDGAAAITGQTLYVDCGYQIMGMY